MEYSPFESAFFGSGVLWMLLTFPAYWLFQWTVEGAPFTVWRRRAASAVSEVSLVVTQSIVDAGSTFAAPADLTSPAALVAEPLYPAAID